MTWPVAKLLLDTHKQFVKSWIQTCNHIWRAQACATRKSARVCVRRGVICTPPVAFMPAATFWTRNCKKEQQNPRSAQDYEWNPDSRELDNNWDLFALTPPYKSHCTSLCVTLALSGLSLIPPFLVLPSLRGPFLPLMSQDEELHQVGLPVHVEDDLMIPCFTFQLFVDFIHLRFIL